MNAGHKRREEVERRARLSLREGNSAGELAWVELTGGVAVDLCWCPPGRFVMGSPTNEPGRGCYEDQVHVRLSRGFWMGKYPVTQAQWQAVTGGNPSHFNGENHPVEKVSWNDCQAFIKRLAEPGSGWRWAVPTEAQWEYACRAGTRTAYWWGETCSGRECNCLESGIGQTTAVGRYGENPWGLCDTLGNVLEWCADWWGDGLSGGLDPVGPSSGTWRAFRGGSWHYAGMYCRSSDRGYFSWNSSIGFRVAAIPALR